MRELKVTLLRPDKIQEWILEINNEVYVVMPREEVPKFLMKLAIDIQVPCSEKLTPRLQ